MINKINGICFKEMIESGLKNLIKQYKSINRINVFPVPDGDTGTNMAVTLKSGLAGVRKLSDSLSDITLSFSRAVTYGARGNSGVILSQFFKGVCDELSSSDYADYALLIKAFESGSRQAREAVTHPVEGTMLTVMQDIVSALKTDNNIQSINDVIKVVLQSGRESLNRTPELLPTLKEAGVVDSGGKGLITIFEGIEKYLNGEEIGNAVFTDSGSIDYSVFNKDSTFKYGYCTELLLQLLNGREEYSHDIIRSKLEKLGNSVVLALMNDKLKIHVHTDDPGRVMQIMQSYGEFLSIKIENMAVCAADELDTEELLTSSQNEETTSHGIIDEVKECKFLTSKANGDNAFAVVAAAFDSEMQSLFVHMGADISAICKNEDDFTEAFDKAAKKNIIVFPNSEENYKLAKKAAESYNRADVRVINSVSVAECYDALPIIDFAESNFDKAVSTIEETINNIDVVDIVKSSDIYNVIYDSKSIFSSGDVNEAVLFAVNEMLVREIDVITLFYNECVNLPQLNEIIASIQDIDSYIEINTVPFCRTCCSSCSKYNSCITISFE